MYLTASRAVPYSLLAMLLCAVGYAQQPTASSASKLDPSPKISSSSQDPVVLTVGNAKVTREQFEATVSSFEKQGESEGEGEKEAEPIKDRKALGDDYASVLMLSQLALKEHLDATPDIHQQLEVARIQILSDAAFTKLMKEAEPTYEETKHYYSTHLSEFVEFQLHRLFIWKKQDNSKNDAALSSQQARARADKFRQTLAGSSDVQKLADDLKASGDGMFDVKPLSFPRGELPPQMERVALSLKNGEWSEVEDTPASLLLIQLVNRHQRQLGEVSSIIHERLQNQKMRMILADLRKKADIWMDDAYFAPETSGSNVAPKVRKSAVKQENNQ